MRRRLLLMMFFRYEMNFIAFPFPLFWVPFFGVYADLVFFLLVSSLARFRILLKRCE